MDDVESNRRRARAIHIPLISTASDARGPGAGPGEIELAAMIVVVTVVGPGSWDVVVAPERGHRQTFRITVDRVSPDP